LSPEDILRPLRDKLRLTQVLVALIATLLSAVPDLRGLQGFRFGEVELAGPAERQHTQESSLLLSRTIEDAEEFFGNDEPDAHIRGVRLSLAQDLKLRGSAASWSPPRLSGCAHPATGPPTA
jgi:hypothetical protein